MKIILLILIFSASLLNPPHTTIYYIDNETGNDFNSGISPQNAWRTISKVNSTTFSPGSKILFRRGGIWNEQLELRGSGTPAERIIISDYGEGALPIIDGGLTRTQCIVLNKNNHITVSNINMRNATRQGAIRVLRCRDVIVEYCTFYVTGHGGVFVESSSGCTIRNNTITTPSGDYNVQTDGIYLQRNDNIIIDGNHIVISNENVKQHADGIQSFQDRDIIIRNNYVEQRNVKRSNAQGLYATTMTGTHTYYNNVVYCPNTRASVLGFRNLDKGRGYLKAYFNTLVGSGSNIMFVSENAGIDAKNNIFYSTGRTSILRLETENITLENNLYYHTGAGDVVGFGKGKRPRQVAEMRIEGKEINGFTADPLFDKDFRLQKNSPAVDRGMVLGPPYDYDKAGVKRNIGKAPDIGAYELKY